MNYYKRHIGDYARDTGHLTVIEHGIYGLLLDWYYVNECPIPHEKAIRIAKGNRTETESVLDEFFTLCDEGWRHSRADREIEDYRRRAAINAETGKLGGRPRKTQSVSEWKPNSNPNITLATSHKPLTNKDQKQEHARQVARGSRFEEFWSVYPVKKGKADAKRSWARKGLDKIADQILDDVRNRQANDGQWIDGYIPHGSTYVNAQGWEDAIEPKRLKNTTKQPSGTLQAVLNMQELKNGLANHGNFDRLPALGMPGPRTPARLGHDSRDGNGVD